MKGKQVHNYREALKALTGGCGFVLVPIDDNELIEGFQVVIRRDELKNDHLPEITFRQSLPPAFIDAFGFPTAIARCYWVHQDSASIVAALRVAGYEVQFEESDTESFL